MKAKQCGSEAREQSRHSRSRLMLKQARLSARGEKEASLLAFRPKTRSHIAATPASSPCSTNKRCLSGLASQEVVGVGFTTMEQGPEGRVLG